MKARYIFLLLILFTFVFSFSCASKPRTTSDFTPEDSSVIEETKEEASEQTDGVDSEKDEQEADSDKNASFETEETDESTENYDETTLPPEPITADELDFIPEFEEEPDFFEPEPEIALEPEVKEAEPETEHQEQTAESNENTAEAVIIAQDSTDSTQNNDGTEGAQPQIQRDELTENHSTDEADSIEQDASEEAETDEPFTEEEEEAAPPQPSRSITIGKNQLIEIVYPGKGWIYQGNIDADGNIDARNRNFVFGGRKLGGSDQSFTLRSRVPGTFLLHFYKNDVLTGSYIDDYLEVIVSDSIEPDTKTITVPAYSEVVPPKITITAETVKAEQKKQQEAKKRAEEDLAAKAEKPRSAATPASSTAKAVSVPAETERISTTIQTSEAQPTGGAQKATEAPQPEARKGAQNATPQEKNTEEPIIKDSISRMNEDELLKTAQKRYSDKDFEGALTAITQFFNKATKNLDKGLFLQGQILEEKSPVQNIKDAIESYDLLVKNYPASSLWEKANKRSIFLKRFYINIR